MRLEVSEHATAGWNETQLAAAGGGSVWSVRKWRRRALHQGRLGFTSQMGRPATGPVSTFPTELKEAILVHSDAQLGHSRGSITSLRVCSQMKKKFSVLLSIGYSKKYAFKIFVLFGMCVIKQLCYSAA
jgi:hypothetical protein